jgi:hypothetical protein
MRREGRSRASEDGRGVADLALPCSYYTVVVLWSSCCRRAVVGLDEEERMGQESAQCEI